MLAQELSSFDALHAFRALSPDEKMESLFLGQRETLMESRKNGLRLDVLNGTTKETKAELEAHIDAHEDQQAGLDYMRVWGSRAGGAVIFLLACLGGIGVTFGLIEAMR